MSTPLWDYIIVGGGLSGSVVANRLLQQDRLVTILVIEAGPNANDDDAITYADSTKLDGGIYDWKYQTSPQEHLNYRSIGIPCGKALGGGSVINYAGWVRGHRTDFDLWGEVVGDDRWSYKGLLPFMKQAENLAGASIDLCEHGIGGPVCIQSSASTDRKYPLRHQVLESWKEVGIDPLPHLDANAGNPIGVGDFYENRRQGRRQIASVTYPLDGITVKTDTMVVKILIRKQQDQGREQPKAIGVQLDDGTKIHGKEIIMSLGAIRTPQLLMLSGIGPAGELAKHGIEVISASSEVGNNLSDHGRVATAWKLRNPSAGYAVGSDNASFQQHQYRWGLPLDFVVTTGVQDKVGLAQAIAADEGTAPDPATHPLLNQDRAFNEHLIMYADGANGSAITLMLVNLLPTSRGEVTLFSPDVHDPPIVNPNYHSTEVDRFIMRDGLRLQIELAGTKATILGRDILAGEVGMPGFQESLTSESTDEYLNSRVAASLISSYHPMGTAAMGKVVDSDLRVKGISGLRVVDASVFPTAITGHLQVAIYALALQAAKIIHDQNMDYTF